MVKPQERETLELLTEALPFLKEESERLWSLDEVPAPEELDDLIYRIKKHLETRRS